MKIGIDPVIDCVFKKLFGSEENKELSISLLNAILESSGEKKIVELELLNPYNPKNFYKDKLSIVDVKAKNELGEWFIIEVQIVMSENFPQRLLYYWAKNYQNQLQEGENYDLLKKVTLISVTKDSLPLPTKHCHNVFKLVEIHNQIPLVEDCEIHTLELTKFLKTAENLTNSIETWTYFLKHGEDLDEDNLPSSFSSPELQKAVKELKMFTAKEIERDLYESRQKAIRDERSRMSENRKKALAEGKAEGKAEAKKEIVVNMLKMDWEIENICKMTGLSVQEVEKVREELAKDS